MTVQEAQRDVRTVFVGGFWGQLVSSVIWLVSAAIGTWVSPRAAILEIVFAGCFIFPLTVLLLRLSGGSTSPTKGNPLSSLGMQNAFTVPLGMLLLIPVTQLRLTLFYPALMILVGAHYLPFIFLYGMRMFAALAAILVTGGIIIEQYSPKSFTLGAWTGGVTLLVFAVIGRITVQRELRNAT